MLECALRNGLQRVWRWGKRRMSPQWWFYAVAAVITSPNPWQVHHGSLQKRPVKWFGLELSDGSPGLPTEA